MCISEGATKGTTRGINQGIRYGSSQVPGTREGMNQVEEESHRDPLRRSVS